MGPDEGVGSPVRNGFVLDRTARRFVPPWADRLLPFGADWVKKGLHLGRIGVMYKQCIYDGGEMQTTVQKWGNSLGVRIPKVLAQGALLKEGARVRMRLKGERLVLEAVAAPRYELDAMLLSVNRRNIHKEVATGGAVGKEAW